MRLSPFGRSTATAGGLTLVAYLVVPLASRLALGSNWLALLSGAAAGTVVFVVGLWRLRDELQLAALRAVRRRRPAPADPG